MKISIARIALFSGMLILPGAAKERTFTSADGKELTAEIVSATEKDVTVKKSSDGKEYKLPLERLSKADQDFVAAWLEKAKINMRPEKDLELEMEDGSKKTMKVPASEYLSWDGTLILYAGETVHLEFAKDGDKWGDAEVVAEVKHPERTITFSLTRTPQLTSLNRKTTMQETVAVDCGSREVDSEDFARNNLIPTEKGKEATDSWGGAVWCVRLTNIDVSTRPALEVYEERLAK